MSAQAGQLFVNHLRHPLTVVDAFLWVGGQGPDRKFGNPEFLSRRAGKLKLTEEQYQPVLSATNAAPDPTLSCALAAAAGALVFPHQLAVRRDQLMAREALNKKRPQHRDALGSLTPGRDAGHSRLLM